MIEAPPLDKSQPGPKDWIDSWHVDPSANKTYNFFDGLRGIAILLVLGCHFIYINPLSQSSWVKFIGGVFSSGYIGVTLFFSLSGFLIAWPFWKRKIRGAAQTMPPGYGWRRFYKIYPPLAFSILLLTPVYIFISNDWSYLPTALKWLLGVPLFTAVSGKLNPVMWSLIVEMHFYIVLPLLFICLKRTSVKASLWIASLAFILIPGCAGWIGCGLGVFTSINPEINLLFPSLMDAFALGVLLAGLESAGVMTEAWAGLGDIGLVLFAGSLLVMSWLNLHAMNHSYTEGFLMGWVVKAASGCLLCYVANPQHPRARLLCQPWLRWCGIVSYEWYLLHQPMVLWMRRFAGPADGNIVRYGLTLGIPFVFSATLAAFLYKKVSMPILKYGREKHASTRRRG